jgi:hypothetical protein
VTASRNVGGTWTSRTLNEVGDVAGKAVLGASAGITDALAVHWISGPSLLFSSDQPAALAPPGDSPPVTSFSTQIKRVKGSKRHTITLQPDEVATVFFRFTGQGVIIGGGTDTTSWQTYTEAVVVQLDKGGSGDFEFYAEDVAGNVEATQLEILQ